MISKWNTGVKASALSAIFLGLAPVVGKQAINIGFSPLAVVGFRTLIAALILILITVIFRRKYLYIYPAGLLGCVMAGTLNGLGSLLYYSALGRINASLGQMLYSLYPFFVAIWLILDAQPPSRLTIIRLALATASIFFLTNIGSGGIDIIGVLQMLGAAILYAIHLPVNQRVLYDVPAPTVTLYTLTAMSLVVFPTYLIFDRILPVDVPWWPIFLLALITFLSRLSLFLGVKHLGGMQAALLGLFELLITVGLSIIWLHETMTFVQWLGAAILGVTLLLVYFEKNDPAPRPVKGGWLSWLRPPGVPPEIS